MNRKKFIRQFSITAMGLSIAPNIILGQDTPAAYQQDVVKKFVGASHGKLDVVKGLLEEFPNLIYSKWDWGGGDFETGLGAASHVGNKTLANLLIEKGASVNIFALTMLGKTDLVKSILMAYPKMIHTLGAHGFTLLHHAQKGGDDAKELFDYFTAQGLTEMRVNL